MYRVYSVFVLDLLHGGTTRNPGLQNEIRYKSPEEYKENISQVVNLLPYSLFLLTTDDVEKATFGVKYLDNKVKKDI